MPGIDHAVIASEAKQSIPPRGGCMDCVASLAMTERVLAEARLRPAGYDAAAFATMGLAEPKQA
jgi:hypothetical protein